MADLNAQDNSGHVANDALAYSYDEVIYFFAYDGIEWHYAGKLGVTVDTITCTALTMNDLGFLGKLK